MKGQKERVYLDYAAATPIDKRVSEVMRKAEREAWGNASSLYAEGEQARKILEEVRRKIAYLLHCRSSEIIFTSGATEAANIAVLGVLKNKKRAHVVTSSIEHPAILEAIKSSGSKVSIVEPEENGVIDPQKIEKEIKANTVLVCLMHANNEIGTIQPVREVSKIKKQAYLLTDASQSALYEDVSIERLGADMMILDGIKMYGPRGAGILVVKRNVEIAPVIFGGGQERGLRSGTENAIATVGLAEALRIASRLRVKESSRLTKLRNFAVAEISKIIPGSTLNGDPDIRLPNNINICFAGQDSEFLVIKLDTLGFAVSAASACSNLNLENSSYVIDSLGKPECGSSSLRFTLGRETRKSDLDKLIVALKKIIK